MNPSRLRRLLGVAGIVALWILADRLLPRGLPPGIALLGVVFGSLNALIAIGIVLVYRSNRVLNFAQAELGGVAAIIAIQLRVQHQVPYAIAIATGLLCGALAGALVDVLVIRRVRNAPRLIVAVATIGIAQVMLGLSLQIPLWWSGSLDAPRPFDAPFGGSISVSGVVFDADHLLVIAVAAILTAGLSIFLRRTEHGVAIRAAADDPDRARLLGIPTARLSTIVWAIAGVLSAVAVLLRVPLFGLQNFGLVTGAGNSILLRALAAAVIARMESLPVAAAAALGLGVAEELSFWTFSRGTYTDAVLVAVILVTLLLRRAPSVRPGTAGLWRALREIRPIPGELRRLPEVRYGFRGLWVAIGILAITFPLYATPPAEQLAALIVIYAIVAVSLVVLTGWSGHISLGQFGLAGLGGATAGILLSRHGWDLFAALPAGMAVGAVAAVVVGLPALRIAGPFLAVTTLGFAVVCASFFLEARNFPWFVPTRVDRPVLWGRFPLDADWKKYLFCVAWLALVAYGVRNLRRSRAGRVLVAVRDGEMAAETVAIHPVRVKLAAFAISGAIAGLAGGLFVLHQGGLDTDSFAPDVSIRLFSMAVIGGLGSIPGAIAGAVYVAGAEYYLHGGWQLLATGAGILVLLLVMPGGLGEGLYRLRDGALRRIARRRGIVVPSLLADVRVDGETSAPRASIPALEDAVP